MGRGQYIDKHGEEIDLLTWIKLGDDPEYGHVGRTVMESPDDPAASVTVVTGWLGINTGSMEIFETATRAGEDDVTIRRRYHTLEEAGQGHNEVVGDVLQETSGVLLVREVEPLDELGKWGES